MPTTSIHTPKHSSFATIDNMGDEKLELTHITSQPAGVYDRVIDPSMSNEEDIKQMVSSDFEVGKDGNLKRGLKARHLQLIALGGAIGTGLFVGSGSALANNGPAALLTGYLVLSLFVWSIMNQLAEMVTFLPIPGKCTPNALCDRYTGNKSLSFTAGFNLFYAQALLSPAELSAAAFVINYWTDLNAGIFIAILWVVLVVLNFSAVKYFGETEFWIASLKLICLTGLIIVSIVIFFGGAPNSDGVLGFHYWKHPGAFNERLTSGSTGRFCAVWSSMIKSAFAFILSPELITCCAAEAKDPRINLPKASNRFIYRLMFFYIFGALCIGVVVAYNDAGLMSAINAGASDAQASPFVIGIQNAGIKVLNHIVNAVILSSAFSAGNSYIYSSSRSLYSMAIRGDVPRLFTACNRFGVPYYCVAMSSALCLLAFLTISSSATTAFTWLSNISTVSGFVSWLIISITYLRFRKAITFHGLDSRVTYRRKFSIFGAWACLVFFSIITLTNGYAVFFDFDVSDFIAAYITIPIILVLYFGHAIVTKNWKFFAPPEEIDCTTGLTEIEAEHAEYVKPIANNFLQRMWYWIA